MKLKGLEKIREKVPNYPGKKIVLFPLIGLITALLGYIFLISLDVLPRVFNSVSLLADLEPFLPILGNLSLGTIGFYLIGLLWRKREQMKERLGELAYQHMIRYGVMGVFLIPPLIFHAATSIRSIPPGPPVNPLTTQWSTSILALLDVPLVMDVWLRLIVSGVFLIFGILTVRSALLTFGLDYMVVVYLYFPAESEIVDHEIYSVLRHPAYFAGILLSLTALFFRFSVYSIVLSLIACVIFQLQIRREEKELIDRFGDSYRDYMKRVPALHVKLRNIRTYLRFLSGES